jgi:RING-box protein 1
MSRFNITKISVVASSYLNIHNDVCPICKNTLTEPCLDCSVQNKQTCNTSIGICNHGFHTHCINTWLENRRTCPLDNQNWGFQKFNKNKNNSLNDADSDDDNSPVVIVRSARSRGGTGGQTGGQVGGQVGGGTGGHTYNIFRGHTGFRGGTGGHTANGVGHTGHPRPAVNTGGHTGFRGGAGGAGHTGQTGPAGNTGNFVMTNPPFGANQAGNTGSVSYNLNSINVLTINNMDSRGNIVNMQELLSEDDTDSDERD